MISGCGLFCLSPPLLLALSMKLRSPRSTRLQDLYRLLCCFCSPDSSSSSSPPPFCVFFPGMEKYLPQLLAEKDALDPSFTHALRMVTEGEGDTTCTITLLGPLTLTEPMYHHGDLLPTPGQGIVGYPYCIRYGGPPATLQTP